MCRLGLALSGGGFRATLFHLGMVRLLRDANLLDSVSHITSVSGGSILAAHLVLNWDRYNGTPQDFDAAAGELLDFIRLDVRNRVVRRFPLTLPLRALQRLALRRPSRFLSRTGLLEYHYQRFLYGDKSLFELPERPRLYLLSTSLSEGCLCAFTRDGLLVQRRQNGRGFRFDQIHVGLATVPMAVTASSAFPGFFPPLQLSAADVGAGGDFPSQTFTDGGVFDNLGIRMFRCLERSWLARDIPLQADDFVDVDALTQALHGAEQRAGGTPLHRLVQLLGSRNGSGSAALIERLWRLIMRENLAREPAFAQLPLADAEAAALQRLVAGTGKDLDAGEMIWLNRHLVDAAFRQTTGAPCLRSPGSPFDGVLVSDAGSPFQVLADAPARGLLGTALRSTDIVMDRVWQLEVETFQDTPGFVFAPMTRVVTPAEDPTAPHPEVQHQSASIRTDLDRFTDLEISSLIRHGYCVARAACRSRPDLFGTDITAAAPWDPLAPATPVPTPHSRTAPGAATLEARRLQESATRRLWSSLLDYRDWVSYIYVPIIVPILVLLPYVVIKAYRESQVANRLVESIAKGSRDYEMMRKLLLEGPVSPWPGLPFEEGGNAQPAANTGFELLSDMRLIDLRPWRFQADGQRGDSWLYGYRRVRVRKSESAAAMPIFRLLVRSSIAGIDFRCPDQRLRPVLRRCKEQTTGEHTLHVWELSFDFHKVPAGEVVDLIVELLSREARPSPDDESLTLPLVVDTETPLLTCWLLLPAGKSYSQFRLLRSDIDAPAKVEVIEPAQLLRTTDGLYSFAILGVRPTYLYECRWSD